MAFRNYELAGLVNIPSQHFSKVVESVINNYFIDLRNHFLWPHAS
jgi:hypothetical protein